MPATRPIFFGSAAKAADPGQTTQSLIHKPKVHFCANFALRQIFQIARCSQSKYTDFWSWARLGKFSKFVKSTFAPDIKVLTTGAKRKLKFAVGAIKLPLFFKKLKQT
jgi:hypothetical protein